MKSCRQMSILSQQILDFVRANPGCDFGDAQLHFYPNSPSGKGSKIELMRSRFHYLASVGYLVNEGNFGNARFAIGPGFTSPKFVSRSPVIAQKTADAGLALVPSPAYDRMNGPKYIPSRHNFARAGSVASMVAV